MSSPSYDALIVGAGFAGATMARLMADAGQRVLVIDKRDHIGGNAYDYVNEHGVRVQKYGVHAFHTNSDAIWEFLSRFTEWHPYEHRVRASVDGGLVPFPPNADTLEQLGMVRFGAALDFLDNADAPENAEQQCVSTVGWDVYSAFFEGYTQKQWGKHPRDLDAALTARIPFRPNSREDRVFTDKYQAIPKDGYTAMFERMLDHPGITVALGAQAESGEGLDLASRSNVHAAWTMAGSPRIVWTGPIDEYFAHRFGPLPYRSLSFHHQSYPGRELRQPCTQINYPAIWQPFTRTIEWRHVTGQECDWTTITTEFPSGEGEPYYPVPAQEARALYKRYEALSREQENVTFIGRLATYQYLNMDQVVGQAMAAFRRLNPARPAL